MYDKIHYNIKNKKNFFFKRKKKKKKKLDNTGEPCPCVFGQALTSLILSLFIHKMMEVYSQSSISMGDWFQDPCEYQNLWLLKSHSRPSVTIDVEPIDTEGQLYLLYRMLRRLK